MTLSFFSGRFDLPASGAQLCGSFLSDAVSFEASDDL